jgi:hypothetical protein
MQGRQRRGLKKDDGVAGSRTAWGQWHHGLGEDDIAGSGQHGIDGMCEGTTGKSITFDSIYNFRRFF